MNSHAIAQITSAVRSAVARMRQDISEAAQ